MPRKLKGKTPTTTERLFLSLDVDFRHYCLHRTEGDRPRIEYLGPNSLNLSAFYFVKKSVIIFLPLFVFLLVPLFVLIYICPSIRHPVCPCISVSICPHISVAPSENWTERINPFYLSSSAVVHRPWQPDSMADWMTASLATSSPWQQIESKCWSNLGDRINDIGIIPPVPSLPPSSADRSKRHSLAIQGLLRDWSKAESCHFI